jgi:hypothetical protein
MLFKDIIIRSLEFGTKKDFQAYLWKYIHNKIKSSLGLNNLATSQSWYVNLWTKMCKVIFSFQRTSTGALPWASRGQGRPGQGLSPSRPTAVQGRAAKRPVPPGRLGGQGILPCGLRVNKGISGVPLAISHSSSAIRQTFGSLEAWALLFVTQSKTKQNEVKRSKTK